LGSSVDVVAPDRGVSVRGTSDDKLFRGDVVRKLLVQMELQADLSQPAQRLPQEPSHKFPLAIWYNHLISH